MTRSAGFFPDLGPDSPPPEDSGGGPPELPPPETGAGIAGKRAPRRLRPLGISSPFPPGIYSARLVLATTGRFILCGMPDGLRQVIWCSPFKWKVAAWAQDPESQFLLLPSAIGARATACGRLFLPGSDLPFSREWEYVIQAEVKPGCIICRVTERVRPGEKKGAALPAPEPPAPLPPDSLWR